MLRGWLEVRQTDSYGKMDLNTIKYGNKSRYTRITVFMVIGLVLLALFCLCVGKYPITPAEVLHILFGGMFGSMPDWEPMQESVVIGLRLPRVIAAIVVGGALSMSGAAFQGTFKNPLVSPDFLGVSSGACVGAAIAILMSLGSAYMQLFAFLGGIAAVLLTSMIPRILRSDSNIMLVLAGIIVGGLMSSILGFLKYVADPETQLASITYWQMGSFSYVNAYSLLAVLPTILVPAILLIAISWRIDVLSLGEREAKSLGVNVGRMRGLVMLCATLLTAGSVCIAGTIGWVGLVIPHLTRMVTGPGNTRLIPSSFLFGGVFMLAVDTVTRTIGTTEMPISILTGIVGAPFYAWLLYRQRMRLV